MGRKPVKIDELRQRRFRKLLEMESLTQTSAGELFGYSEGMISGFATGRYNVNDGVIDVIMSTFPEKYNRAWLQGDPDATVFQIKVEPELFLTDPAITEIMSFLGPEFSYWKTEGDETRLEIVTKDGENAGSISMEQAQELKRMIDDFRGLILFRIKGGK